MMVRLKKFALTPFRKKEIIDQPMNDPRSYHVSSEKIFRILGFKPKNSIRDAIQSIRVAYQEGKFTDPLTNPTYHNIKTMKELTSEGSV